jgi:hypothetical protein
MLDMKQLFFFKFMNSLVQCQHKTNRKKSCNMRGLSGQSEAWGILAKNETSKIKNYSVTISSKLFK